MSPRRFYWAGRVRHRCGQGMGRATAEAFAAAGATVVLTDVPAGTAEAAVDGLVGARVAHQLAACGRQRLDNAPPEIGPVIWAHAGSEIELTAAIASRYEN